MKDRSLSAVDVAVMSLAVFRLTRLVTTDTLPPIQAIRESLIRKAGKDSILAEGLRCDWCASVWLSAMVVPIVLRFSRAHKALLIPAMSAVAGLLSTADSALGRMGN